MTEAQPRLLGALALGVAAVFAIAVAAGYIFFLGADDAAAPSPPASPGAEEAPFGGTPIPDIEGMPTPISGTGVIDDHRPEVGEPVPAFALADARDPSQVRELAEFTGGPLVLNWYADWCQPCRDELPEFQAAQDALGDEVTFLAINFLEGQDTALKPLDELGITFPAVLDTNGAVSDHFRIGAHLPVTMTVDAEGIIRRIHVGPLLGEDLEEALTEIGLDYESG